MRESRPVTLITVARQAGVSKTTASDALTGTGRVSPATRDRVMQTATMLGYVPNSSARHLRRAVTGTIGLHLPEVLTRSDYYMRFVFGAVDQAAAHGYDLTLITSGHGSVRPRLPRVDGIVLGDPLGGDAAVEHLIGSELPIVTCERFPGRDVLDGVVRSEHDAALRVLLDHLHDAGARRPALVVSSGESDWAADLGRGYREWCREHRVEPRIRTITFGSGTEAAAPAAADLLSAHPDTDALVCGPDGAAAAALPVIRAAGREAGRDLLLASCVDSPAMAEADPPITAIDLRPREAGARCAELLFEVLNGSAPPGTERIHPIALVPRASTQGTH
ncbi:LacI family transcriptional regulator [Murinocardiopsis flavida]|uniref:LacI family transcriptional regulator n=1 Tax=Murinocardiopsis flavida TaxID=645275 RepID=A0A2P8DSW2_9ACTN|nr:LacI family DNA-binding transcriptional regulator [Murinocardiopsis flavida]PSL00309.1 LacI family transcriptional regulator [Murinocardiopsis flavida]